MALTEDPLSARDGIPASVGVRQRVLFDVTGVVHWYAFFSHPSGIQRVTEKLIRTLILRQDSRVEFVARMLGSETFYRIEPGLLADLDAPSRRFAAIARLRALFAGSMRLAPLRLLLRDARYYHVPYILIGLLHLDPLVQWVFAGRRAERLPPLQPAPLPDRGDVLFNPGDLWWQKNYVSVLIALQARTGVRLVQMIHDLFVIERPEWFQPGFARLFAGEFQKLAPHVDRWLTNSRYVTGQLARYLEGRSLPVQPCAVLPMGWDSFAHLGAEDAEARRRDHEALQRRGLAGRRFILFVGTVEPRKEPADLARCLGKPAEGAEGGRPAGH